jgi:uncharacterized phage protein (TIGR01671 family)
MREIKFRAWDKHEKEMSYSVNVYSESDGDTWWSADHINPETGDTICSFDGKAGVLMQFTGLKDKNGKEIFEGDLIRRVNFPGEKILSVRWAEILCRYVADVYFPNGEVGKCLYSLNQDYLIEYPVEIIGNIYENPEILK